MPRKSRKKPRLDTHKQPLLFLEPPLDGARHHNVPQVRGALYPRSFVTEKQGQTNDTASTSWVSPQFDQVQLRAAQTRRGKRFQTTSISDRSGQLSRKTRACKYPSLSFEKKTAAQPNQQRNEHTKRAAGTVAGRGVQTTSHPAQRTAVADNETPKCHPSLRERTADGTRLARLSEVTPEGAATSRSCFDHGRAPASRTTKHNKVPGCSTSTPGSANHPIPPDPIGALTIPGVETPDPTPSTSFLRLLLPASQPSTPQRQEDPETLVTDTPEMDYGLKVTWRRRKGLMMLLRDRGQLSSPEVRIMI